MDSARTNFDPAITELENRVEVMNTNAPINEREGRKGQAALERHIAKSCKGAIKTLKDKWKEIAKEIK